MQLAFWRLAGGTEVDFVVDDFRLALEAKATRRVHSDHLKGLREVAVDHRVQRRAVVSLDERPRRTDEGIDVLPWRTFTAQLWAGDLIPA